MFRRIIMNINSPSILSLFSSVEGQDKLQQALLLEGEGTQAFSEALLLKIDQLKSLTGLDLISEELSTISLLENSAEPKIADFLNGKDAFTGISEVFGNSLPSKDQLTKGIDLEKTLETLSNVLNTFEDGLSEEINLTTHLDQIVDEIQNLKEIILNDEGSSGSAYLENQLELLTAEVEFLKESFSHDSIIPQQVANPVQLIGGTISRDLSGGTSEKQQLFTTFNTTGDKTLETSLEPDLIEKKFEINKQLSSQQANIGQREESQVDGSAKTSMTDLEAILQQVKVSPKSVEIESTGFLDELVSDKGVPKIISSMALLNRVLLPENQADIPAMTKHFVQPGWDQEFSEKILWMHKNATPSAELKLNPKHLGPISIKVDVTQDQATISFTAQHAAVKEAIEAAIPKLREMFSAQQINLLDVNVSQQESGERQSRDFNQMSHQANGNEQDTQDQNSNENKQDTTELVGEIEAGRAIASNGILSIFA